MPAPPFLSLVIPAYNEASIIAGTLTSVADFLNSQPFDWELLVADDGSTDATASIVQLHAHRDPRIKLLKLPHGGKGWAVRNGMLQARGLYRFLCDADLSMPIQQLSRFLPPQGPNADVVIASREGPGARRLGEPWTRHVMGRMFNLLTRLFALSRVSDSQCGFKSFTAAAAQQLFPLQRLNGFGFDVELLFLSRKLGITVDQVPIDWYYRHGGKVRPFQDSLRMIGDLLAIRWASLRGRYNRAASAVQQQVPP